MLVRGLKRSLLILFAPWFGTLSGSLKHGFMDSKGFKRKKFSHSQVHPKFPSRKDGETYIGVFDGHSVSVFEKDAIYDIYIKGNFGKGSLSRSAPACIDGEDDTPPVILEQQWQNQLKWKEDIESQATPSHSGRDKNDISADSVQDFLNFALSGHHGNSWKEYKANLNECGNIKAVRTLGTSCAESSSHMETESGFHHDPLGKMVEDILHTGKIKEPKTKGRNKLVLVAENVQNPEESEDFNISDVKVALRNDFHYREECLKLDLPEAFFLCSAIGCLKITKSDGSEMSVNDLWEEFRKLDRNFIEKYVFYHHYRAHGWTVRSGLRFGGDYLLYKIGPMYYHASYLVWILDRRKKKKKMTWNEFISLNRLVETCNKDLLLCEILGPGIEEETFPNTFKEFSLLEFISKRWIPSQEREQKNP